MAVLTRREILQFIKEGRLAFSPQLDKFQLQPHAVDLRLGFDFQIPQRWYVDEKGRHALIIDNIEKDINGFEQIKLKPGQFFEFLPQETIIAATLEKITLNHPSLMAVLYPRSSLNRRGLAVDLSGIVDVNYSGHLIIPLKNNTKQVIKLYPGERICQLVFERLASDLTAEETRTHGAMRAKYSHNGNSTYTKDAQDENDYLKLGAINKIKEKYPLEYDKFHPQTPSEDPEMPKIEYPYIPDGRAILYVDENHSAMREAKKMLAYSGCAKQATAAVLVKDGQIIGRGSNAGKRIPKCPRVTAGYGTGQGYHLCRQICEQKGHAEIMAVRDARSNGNSTRESDLYLYGHWWCCKECWNCMIEAGIKNVYLLHKSWELFKK